MHPNAKPWLRNSSIHCGANIAGISCDRGMGLELLNHFLLIPVQPEDLTYLTDLLLDFQLMSIPQPDVKYD